MTATAAPNTAELDRLDDAELADRLTEAGRRIGGELRKVIVGNDAIVEQSLIALFAGGNCLLVGVPGLAKTLMIRSVAEAMRLGIPIMGMVDTNCDPDQIDYIIPSNDDAIRAVRVITAKIADASIEGRQRRESDRADIDYTIEPGEYSFAPDDEEF